MKKLLLATLLVSASSILSLGCGPDGGGGSCGLAPCGGDIVGTWNTSSICVDTSALMDSFMVDGCPQASIGAVAFTATGPITYNADLTYAVNLTLNGTFAFNFPGACLNGASCADLDAAVKAQVAADTTPTIQSASCTGSGDCVCTFVALPQTTGESGTYTISGSSIISTSNGTTDAVDYCVKGSTVVFREPTMAGMPSEVSAIVAEKQ